MLKVIAVALVLILIAIIFGLMDGAPSDLELRPNSCSFPEQGIIYTDQQCDAAQQALFALKTIPAIAVSIAALMLTCLWQIGYRLYRLWRWKRYAASLCDKKSKEGTNRVGWVTLWINFAAYFKHHRLS